MAKSKEIKAVVNINETDYKLNFGLKFLREIGMLPNDFESNNGVFSGIVGGILESDPFSLLTALKASLSTYDNLSDEAIEEWFETYDKVDELFENFIVFLESAPLTAKKTKKMTELYKSIMKEMNL